MTSKLLRALVGGTRQMLAVQLFTSVVVIALAAWSLAITNQIIRERDRLRERVVQLEEELGARGIVVPATPAVVSTQTPRRDVYPAEVGLEATAPEQVFDPGRIVGDFFAPAPDLHTLVIHARNEADGEQARQLAESIERESALQVLVNVLAPRDPRASGYAYYDGRHSRAAAAAVAQFNDSARRAAIPQWSAQLRGTALPEQGEFSAGRLDIVLPSLPATEAPPPSASPTP